MDLETLFIQIGFVILKYSVCILAGKAGYNKYLALIPGYDIYLLFKIAGEKPWKMIFLIFPVVNLYYYIKIISRIAEAFNYERYGSMTILSAWPGLQPIGFFLMAESSHEYTRQEEIEGIF